MARAHHKVVSVDLTTLRRLHQLVRLATGCVQVMVCRRHNIVCVELCLELVEGVVTRLRMVLQE